MKTAVTLEDIADLIVAQGESIARLETTFDDFRNEMRAEMADFKMELRADLASFRMEVVPRLDNLEGEVQAIHSDLGEIYDRLGNIERGIQRRDGGGLDWSLS